MSHSRFMATAIMMLCVSMLCRLPAHAVTSHSEPERILADASTAFDEAAAKLRADPAEARRLLDHSISEFERLVSEHGSVNGALFYNIANAHMLKGDVGRAILNYRRAQQLNPGDPNIAANLGVARSRVSPRIAQATDQRVLRTVLFWHYDVPPHIRFRVFAFAFAGLWLVALLRLVSLAQGWVWWGVGFLTIVSSSSFASLIVEQSQKQEARQAVVIAQELVGRKGPDHAAYEPSFTEPLGAGVEVRIVESRPGWALVRLTDGRETWIPLTAIETI